MNGVFDIHLTAVFGRTAQKHPNSTPQKHVDTFSQALRAAVVLKPAAAENGLRVLKK